MVWGQKSLRSSNNERKNVLLDQVMRHTIKKCLQQYKELYFYHSSCWKLFSISQWQKPRLQKATSCTKLCRTKYSIKSRIVSRQKNSIFEEKRKILAGNNQSAITWNDDGHFHANTVVGKRKTENTVTLISLNSYCRLVFSKSIAWFKKMRHLTPSISLQRVNAKRQ